MRCRPLTQHSGPIPGFTLGQCHRWRICGTGPRKNFCQANRLPAGIAYPIGSDVDHSGYGRNSPQNTQPRGVYVRDILKMAKFSFTIVTARWAVPDNLACRWWNSYNFWQAGQAGSYGGPEADGQDGDPDPMRIGLETPRGVLFQKKLTQEAGRHKLQGV